MAGPEGERPYVDRTSQGKPTEQHKPQREGKNGSLGLPRTVNVWAKPPPEGSAQGERHSASVQEPQPETETVPAPAKRPRGRPRTLDDPLAWENYYKKQLESNRAYKKANRDKVNEQRRRRYKERKEQGRLPSRKQQPTQVYPPPAQQD